MNDLLKFSCILYESFNFNQTCISIENMNVEKCGHTAFITWRYQWQIQRGLRGFARTPPPRQPFLNILWKWNNLVSGRPNYFIFMGHLRKWDQNQSESQHLDIYEPFLRNPGSAPGYALKSSYFIWYSTCKYITHPPSVSYMYTYNARQMEPITMTFSIFLYFIDKWCN